MPVGVRVYVAYAALAGLAFVAVGPAVPAAGARPTIGAWLVWTALYIGTLAAFFLTLRRYVARAAGASRPAPPA